MSAAGNKHWDEAGLAVANCEAEPERLFYRPAEFPYRREAGLHVGHVFKYCGLDALAPSPARVAELPSSR